MTIDLLNRCHDDAQELAVKLAKTRVLLANLHEAVENQHKGGAYAAYLQLQMAIVAKELSE